EGLLDDLSVSGEGDGPFSHEPVLSLPASGDEADLRSGRLHDPERLAAGVERKESPLDQIPFDISSERPAHCPIRIQGVSVKEKRRAASHIVLEEDNLILLLKADCGLRLH